MSETKDDKVCDVIIEEEDEQGSLDGSDGDNVVTISNDTSLSSEDRRSGKGGSIKVIRKTVKRSKRNNLKKIYVNKMGYIIRMYEFIKKYLRITILISFNITISILFCAFVLVTTYLVYTLLNNISESYRILDYLVNEGKSKCTSELNVMGSMNISILTIILVTTIIFPNIISKCRNIFIGSIRSMITLVTSTLKKLYRLLFSRTSKELVLVEDTRIVEGLYDEKSMSINN